ncbi:DUF4248 domain-containing protein [uncultured Bacteroides sp.]|uniref:DUF4248 domain-containing protein n=1 Tax=uncultured Bacteroides sp. TaxID=162156 RepID=UPI002AA69551|nr:DUF4248 domain-containing protein [uncultured Bacteroides sp.]
MKSEYEENSDRSFPIRTYSKAELAMLYCPNQCITLALNTLYRWMRLNTALMAELQSVGYYRFRRSFTPLEVRIIVKYLGEPG